MRDDRLRLEDILEAIQQIEKYAQGGREAFYKDELIRVWVLHHLEVIGGSLPWPLGAVSEVAHRGGLV